MKRYLLALLLLIPLALVACGGDDDDGEQSDALEHELSATPRVIEDSGRDRARERAVQFNGDDGLRLKGAYYRGDESTALVVLLHSAGMDRHEWDEYVGTFYEAGYDVLALDIRGHGESNEYVIVGGNTFRANPLALRADDAVTDVSTVIEQLPERYQALPLPVFVVGIDAGANIAWLSSGIEEQVVAAIAISAEDTRPDGALSGEAFPDAEPHDVLFVAGPEDLADANSLLETVSGDAEVFEASAGADADLLAQESVTEAILAWIQDHLTATP